MTASDGKLLDGHRRDWCISVHKVLGMVVQVVMMPALGVEMKPCPNATDYEMRLVEDEIRLQDEYSNITCGRLFESSTLALHSS